MKRILIISLMLVVALGCQKETTTTTPAGETAVAQKALGPEELGDLGARIQKNPGEAEKLLAQHGLTEESFQQAVRKVAENPEESKRYAAAYKRATS
jgi:hypothetical protein